ncbi:LIM domain only protein 7, partial [Xenotaenia resolanae]
MLPYRDSVGIQKEIPLTSSATVLNILPLFSNLPHPSSHSAPLPPSFSPHPIFAGCCCSLFFVFLLFSPQAVTKKKFGNGDFRSALENGVLLCDLINKIKPGIIKKVNRLPTPIAGLDNLNVFLKACGKLGLKEAQLFHPGDLQDLSTRVTVKHQETNRRLKNVLITIYWLGRRAQSDRYYDGPYLNFRAFEGLLGTALYK